MSAERIVAIGVTVWLLTLLILLVAAFYQVSETEQVIITQFGRPIGEPVTEPGLHAKVPFIQVANYSDKRFLEWDGDPNQVPTRDKQLITVDTYALWRINDPLLFFQRVRDDRGAGTRLADIIDGETRNAVARHDLVEVGREAITREILERSIERARDLGIEILDLRFKRINYIEEVQQEVFARVIADNQKKALDLYQESLDLLRADGTDDLMKQEQMAEIEAKIEKMKQELER